MFAFFKSFIPAVVPRRFLVLVAMTAVFITCLTIANLVGSFLFSFQLPQALSGTTVLLSAGIIPFPITFILTDLLNEFYGEKTAKFVTLLGFAMSVLVFGILSVAEYLPVDSRSPLSQAEFLHLSGLYTGMFVASLTAYLIGQLLDISLFQWFKKMTGNKMIWLRAQGSTVISQLFDSFIVTSIAFMGTLSAGSITQLALSNYVWKFMIVVIITPLLYLGHYLLNNLISTSDR